jgi:hypothetical protein
MGLSSHKVIKCFVCYLAVAFLSHSVFLSLRLPPARVALRSALPATAYTLQVSNSVLPAVFSSPVSSLQKSPTPAATLQLSVDSASMYGVHISTVVADRRPSPAWLAFSALARQGLHLGGAQYRRAWSLWASFPWSYWRTTWQGRKRKENVPKTSRASSSPNRARVDCHGVGPWYAVCLGARIRWPVVRHWRRLS